MACFHVKIEIRFGRLLTMLVLLLCVAQSGWAEGRSVTIQVRREVTTDRPRVTLADVATIQTADLSIQSRLADVDLCDFKKSQSCRVSQQQIRLRLALAGYPVGQIQLAGSKEVVIQFQKETIARPWSVQDAIIEEVAKRIDRPIDQVRVKVLRPWNLSGGKRAVVDWQSLPEIVLPEGPIAGRRSVEVRYFNRQNIYETRSVPVEVSIQSVEVRMIKSIGREGVISTQNVISHVRFQRSTSGTISLSDVIGRRVRRSMQIGEKVTAADLLPVESVDAKEIVVRSRDAIRLIARQGALEFVIPRAEAMQSGRVGQVIRVKNLQSNRIVNARLVSAEEAVVDLP